MQQRHVITLVTTMVQISASYFIHSPRYLAWYTTLRVWSTYGVANTLVHIHTSHFRARTVVSLTSLPPMCLHTASNQRLEVGVVWERGSLRCHVQRNGILCQSNLNMKYVRTVANMYIFSSINRLGDRYTERQHSLPLSTIN